MTAGQSRVAGAVTVVVCLLGPASLLCAQEVEVTPFGGYRFGNDFFELITGRPVDDDGAPAVGLIVDVPLHEGLQFEALFTHQNARISVPSLFGPASHWHVSVDHLQAGGLQEYADGPVRPFATGMLGLTRYAGVGDSEVRFTAGAGGGVKLFPASKVGVRLGSQVFATFVYANANVLACSPGFCFLHLNVDIVWQIEFTAALIVKVP
jgi:hypothetical protein